MTASSKFKEYIWLINILKKYEKISFSEINKLWCRTEISEGVEMTRSTFFRDKNAIQDIFGLFIDCDNRDGYKYYIGNSEVLSDNSIQKWMLSTLAANNFIVESISLNNLILLEEVPFSEHLFNVIDAIKKKVKIEITYIEHHSNKQSTLTIAPYCVKLFHQRWFILGNLKDTFIKDDVSNSLSVFSLNQIVEMKPTNIKFELHEGFDAREYFSDSYGIIVDERLKPQSILVRAFGIEVQNLREIPLHHSQKEIQITEQYSDFEFKIRPTTDFKTELFRRCNRLKVIKPKSIALEIKEMLSEAMELYRGGVI
ncbi:MAG: helix-turn-helix transcriptional regulator [Candidatus Limimorpha sp.]